MLWSILRLHINWSHHSTFMVVILLGPFTTLATIPSPAWSILAPLPEQLSLICHLFPDSPCICLCNTTSFISTSGFVLFIFVFQYAPMEILSWGILLFITKCHYLKVYWFNNFDSNASIIGLVVYFILRSCIFSIFLASTSHRKLNLFLFIWSPTLQPFVELFPHFPWYKVITFNFVSPNENKAHFNYLCHCIYIVNQKDLWNQTPSVDLGTSPPTHGGGQGEIHTFWNGNSTPPWVHWLDSSLLSTDCPGSRGAYKPSLKG